MTDLICKATKSGWLELNPQRLLWIATLFAVLACDESFGQIPHAQTEPPGPALSVTDAIAKMTVPPGFKVEAVAQEPALVNPVSMTIDERGRFWITESLEYPRREPGPGKDRVKVFEDTDGDGIAEKMTVFMEGLNIPSGIAVGHGGVWIANAPDILFARDTNGDGVADKTEVVVTGFGRLDTHELPNSLTWGPDGWLYGLNGVFNNSHVKYHPDNPNYAAAEKAKHPGWPITCAMFRINPRTKEFQVFCEGTSNPWGIAFDNEGEAFVSACVIDHLWHLVETGYYHRQGGPYPPHTWKIESIVGHKHQKAAYCGIHWFDSDAFPEQYRQKLFMGNIHGGCINVDRVERRGSTYAGSGEPDFLTANDAWFMPIVQKTGPDGSLYLLDWYDRYHCYQDANRDPAGIDRLKGRLYRVRYQQTPRKWNFDLAKQSDAELIENLRSGNGWLRETSRRVLAERSDRATAKQLESLVLSPKNSDQIRREAFWTRVSFATVSQEFVIKAWQQSLAPGKSDPWLQSWVLRTANSHFPELAGKFVWELNQKNYSDVDPRVRIQWAIAARRMVKPTNGSTLDADQAFIAVTGIADTAGDDPLLPRIAWQAIVSMTKANPISAYQLFSSRASQENPEPMLSRLLPLFGETENGLGNVLELISGAYAASDVPAAKRQQFYQVLYDASISGAISPTCQASLRKQLEANPAYKSAKFDASTMRVVKSLMVLWGGEVDLAEFRELAISSQANREARLNALRTMIKGRPKEGLEIAASVLAAKPYDAALVADTLALLATTPGQEAAEIVLKQYGSLPAEIQPRAIELLTQRPAWGILLMQQVAAKAIPASTISINQARRMRDSKNPELASLITSHWGEIRDVRSSDREKIIAEVKYLVRHQPGNPLAGEKVFKKLCGQCHKIYGEGVEVGPDITRNGRNDYTQLLSNIFDPSLVIGAGYRSYTVATEDGRTINGLLVEDSPQRVVLKVQGGKLETIPRTEVDVAKVSELSLMPEGIERQLSSQEIADLVSFVSLDKHPSDPTAQRLPGVGEVVSRDSNRTTDFPSMIGEVAPGFAIQESGENGLGILATYRNRVGVLRTHPISKEVPCVLKQTIDLTGAKSARLVAQLSNDQRGDWRCVAKANGDVLFDEIISDKTTGNGWKAISIDLSKYLGKPLLVELANQANDWKFEFGYWHDVEVKVEK